MAELRDGNLVEKSKRLVWARFNHYTAGEMRLLETYLSRINPRDPESSRVQFTLAEYKELLGRPELDVRNVRPQLDHFLGNVVTIEGIKNGAPAWEMYTLFTRATCLYDEELRQYVISINCNPELRSVFFDLAEDGYIRYRLRYTKDMKSQYSIKLYGMLRDWLHKGSYTVPVERLREELGATEKSYLQFRRFREWVIDRAVSEINSLSDLKVTYTKIKKGRSVTDICFKIKLKPTQKTIEVQAKEIPQEHGGEWFAEGMGADISPESAWKLALLVKDKLADLHPDIPADQHDNAAREILQRAYAALLPADKEPAPENPAGYLWSVLCRGAAIDEYLPVTYGKGLLG
ncbi:MAG: replication initiation protein [[Clostridium] leptum]|jgi:hypothetical protein